MPARFWPEQGLDVDSAGPGSRRQIHERLHPRHKTRRGLLRARLLRMERINGTEPYSRAHNPHQSGLGFFERYLSLWVALCMAGRCRSWQTAARLPCRRLRGIEFGQGSQINIPIAVLIWLMITPMMMKVDFVVDPQRRAEARGSARHAVRQLAGQAVLDGALAGSSSGSSSPVSSARRSGPVHRRLHHSGRCAMHGDGVCLEPSHGRRPGLHARAGVGERSHHARAVRADRAVPVTGASSLTVPFRVLLYSVLVFIVIPLAAGTLLRLVLIRAAAAKYGLKASCCRDSRRSPSPRCSLRSS